MTLYDLRLNLPDQGCQVCVGCWDIQLIKVNFTRVEGKLDRKAELGVHEQGDLVPGFLQGPLLDKYMVRWVKTQALQEEETEESYLFKLTRQEKYKKEHF